MLYCIKGHLGMAMADCEFVTDSMIRGIIFSEPFEMLSLAKVYSVYEKLVMWKTGMLWPFKEVIRYRIQEIFRGTKLSRSLKNTSIRSKTFTVAALVKHLEMCNKHLKIISMHT